MPTINYNTIAERNIKSFVKNSNSAQEHNIKARQKELFSFFKKSSPKIENTRNGPCKYFGQYENFKKQGYGLYISQNGEEWLGQWQNGKKHGDFIGKAKSGNIYHYKYENGIVTGKNTIYEKPNLNSSIRLRNSQIVNRETSQQPQAVTADQRPRSATIQQNIARATENLVAIGRGNNTGVANNINQISRPQNLNQQQIQRPAFLATNSQSTQIRTQLIAHESISRVPSAVRRNRSEREADHLLQNILNNNYNNSGNFLTNQESSVKSAIEIKKENEDKENKAVDLFIKEASKGKGLTKNTAININNPKIIEFIGNQKNKGKKIDIIASILKISKYKNDGKEIFNCLKKLGLISPYSPGIADIKKLFAILHQDNRSKYSKAFSEFFKTYCQEQSYFNGSFLLNEILTLDNHILKSLAPEDVIKSLYPLERLCEGRGKHSINNNPALRNIFVENIGKTCLFKENEPYFIENKEVLGAIKLNLEKIVNEPSIKTSLRYQITKLFDNNPDKNQCLINLLLFFNKNPIKFTTDQESRELLSSLVLHNINKEIMPSIDIKEDVSELAQYTKHLTSSATLFNKTQEKIATYTKTSIPVYQYTPGSQSVLRLQNSSEEITELEERCKDSANAGKEIFDFIEKKAKMVADNSEDRDSKENKLKIYKALEARKNQIFCLLQNNSPQELEELCSNLYNIATGTANDGCVANIGAQINIFVENMAIAEAPESLKILNRTLKEILQEFNRSYIISDILGSEAESDIYQKNIYEDFLINERLLIEKIRAELDNEQCGNILNKKFCNCFIGNKISTTEQQDLALATILIELKEQGIDLTENCSEYQRLADLYNQKSAKEQELAKSDKEESENNSKNLKLAELSRKDSITKDILVREESRIEDNLDSEGLVIEIVDTRPSTNITNHQSGRNPTDNMNRYRVDF